MFQIKTYKLSDEIIVPVSFSSLPSTRNYHYYVTGFNYIIHVLREGENKEQLTHTIRVRNNFCGCFTLHK